MLLFGVLLTAAGLMSTLTAFGLVPLWEWALDVPVDAGWVSILFLTAGPSLIVCSWRSASYRQTTGPDACLTPVPQLFILEDRNGARRGVLAVSSFRHHGSQLPVGFGFADGTARQFSSDHRMRIAEPHDLFRRLRRPPLDINRVGYLPLGESALAVLATIWNNTRAGRVDFVEESRLAELLSDGVPDWPERLRELETKRLVKRRSHGLIHRAYHFGVTPAGGVMLAERMRERGEEIYLDANRERPVMITNGSGIVVVGGTNTTITQSQGHPGVGAPAIPTEALRSLVAAVEQIAARLDELDAAALRQAASEIVLELDSPAPDQDRMTRAVRSAVRVGSDVGTSVLGSAVWSSISFWAGLAS